jgi:hypothetical protein
MSKNILRAVTLAAALAAGGAHAASLGQNLIVNGDAENGTTGWTTFAGTPIFGAVEYSSNWVLPSEPGPANRGSFLFVGDSGNAYAAGSQSVDVSNLSGLINAGAVTYSLNGWLGGWTSQLDNALLYVQFQNASAFDLGTAQLGPMTPTDRNNTTGLFFTSTGGALPVGTTSVVFSLSMERLNGGDNDGYADNLAFSLTAVPEPQTYALMFAGLLAVGAAARAQRRR